MVWGEGKGRMADFCWRCLAADIYPEHPERNDLKGLCAPGQFAVALCEGCGVIKVNHLGQPVGVSEVVVEDDITEGDRWTIRRFVTEGDDWVTIEAHDVRQSDPSIKTVDLVRALQGLGVEVAA